MKRQDWSISSELCKLAALDDPSAALAQLGLISHAGASFDIQERSGWARSGAETYSFVFSVREQEGPETVCRLKACVTFSPGLAIDEVLASWLDRRSLLQRSGVSVPHLYGSGGGVILEEEIAFSMKTVLLRTEPKTPLAGLLEIAAALAKLKFAPVNAFADVKSRGTDAVYIDFGADLGSPHQAGTSAEAVFQQLLEQLSRWTFDMSNVEISQLHEAYNARLGASIQ